MMDASFDDTLATERIANYILLRIIPLNAKQIKMDTDEQIEGVYFILIYPQYN